MWPVNLFPQVRIREGDNVSASSPPYPQSAPVSLSLCLYHYIPLSLSLIVCDGNAIGVFVGICVCVCVCARVCLKRRSLYCSGRGRLTGGIFLLHHPLLSFSSIFSESSSPVLHSTERHLACPITPHPSPASHTHTKAFFLVTPPPHTLTQHYKRRSASLMLG